MGGGLGEFFSLKPGFARLQKLCSTLEGGGLQLDWELLARQKCWLAAAPQGEGEIRPTKSPGGNPCFGCQLPGLENCTDTGGPSNAGHATAWPHSRSADRGGQEGEGQGQGRLGRLWRAPIPEHQRRSPAHSLKPVDWVQQIDGGDRTLGDGGALWVGGRGAELDVKQQGICAQDFKLKKNRT